MSESTEAFKSPCGAETLARYSADREPVTYSAQLNGESVDAVAIGVISERCSRPFTCCGPNAASCSKLPTCASSACRTLQRSGPRTKESRRSHAVASTADATSKARSATRNTWWPSGWIATPNTVSLSEAQADQIIDLVGAWRQIATTTIHIKQPGGYEISEACAESRPR